MPDKPENKPKPVIKYVPMAKRAKPEEKELSWGDVAKGTGALVSRVGGQVGGAFLGGLAGLPLGPAGVAGGAIAGGAAGGAGGEYLAQMLEGRDKTNMGRVAVAGATGAIPASFLVRAGKPLLGAAIGAGQGYITTASNKLADKVAPGDAFNPLSKEWGLGDIMSPVLGGAMGGGMSALAGRKLGSTPIPDVEVTPTKKDYSVSPRARRTSEEGTAFRMPPPKDAPKVETPSPLAQYTAREEAARTAEQRAKPAMAAKKAAIKAGAQAAASDTRPSTTLPNVPRQPIVVEQGPGFAVTNPEAAVLKHGDSRIGLPEPPSELTQAALGKAANPRMATAQVAAERQAAKAATRQEIAVDVAEANAAAKIPAAANKAQAQAADLIEKEAAAQARALDKQAQAAQKATENQRKLDTINEAKEGLERSEPRVSESISATTPEGGKASKSVSYRKPPPPDSEGGDTGGGGGTRGVPMTDIDPVNLKPTFKAEADANLRRLATEGGVKIDAGDAPPSVPKAPPPPKGGPKGPPPMAGGVLVPKPTPKPKGPTPAVAKAIPVVAPKPTLTKGAKLAESDKSAAELEAVMDRIHGEDRPTFTNGGEATRPPIPTKAPKNVIKEAKSLEDIKAQTGVTSGKVPFKPGATAKPRGVVITKNETAPGGWSRKEFPVDVPPEPGKAPAPTFKEQLEATLKKGQADIEAKKAKLRAAKTPEEIVAALPKSLQASGQKTVDILNKGKAKTTPVVASTAPKPVVAKPTDATPVVAKPVKAAAPIADSTKAAETVAKQINKEVDLSGAKSAKDVHTKVLETLAGELEDAKKSAGFGEVTFSRPTAASDGSILVDGKYVGRVSRNGEFTWHGGEGLPENVTLSGKPKDLTVKPSYANKEYISISNLTPSEANARIASTVAAAIGRAKGVGQLVVKVPGDGTFTIERNPHAINEVAKRLNKLGTSSWKDLVKKPSIKSETGAIGLTPALRLAGGLGGAAYGASGEDKTTAERLKGAILGGAAGAALPSAGKLLKSDTIGKASKGIGSRLANFQRFSLLSHPTGLTYNAVAGPWGANLFGGLERLAGGHPEQGKAILKETFNVPKWGKNFFKNFDPARKKIEETERAGMQYVGDTGFDKAVSFPADAMTAGDFTARDIFTAAGVDKDLARKLTNTAEVKIPTLKNLANFGKTRDEYGNTALAANLMLPFKRTAANLIENGLERNPLTGEILNAWRKAKAPGDVIPGIERAAQQGIGTLVSIGAYEAGRLTPDDTERSFKIRNLVSNIAGPYAAVAGVAFAAGQASRHGKSPIKGAVTGAGQSLPLPTAQPLTDLLKPVIRTAAGQPVRLKDIPDSLVPKFIPAWIEQIQKRSQE